MQKPRLDEICRDHKPNVSLNTHRGDMQEVPLPHKSCGLSLSARASNMAFSYPHFNSETDSTTHVRLFMNVWNVNHMAQRLPEEEAHQSKMTEFVLTLDGRATFWHSKMDLPAIKTFDELQSAFLQFFHRRVLQREIIRQFYTGKQLPVESIADFS